MTGVASHRSQWDPASQRSAASLLLRSLSLLHPSAEQLQRFFKKKSVVDKKPFSD